MALALTASCAFGPTSPKTSATPPQINVRGAGTNCAVADHGLSEAAFGWSFCYPATWKFQERLQPTATPRGVDATFEITDASPQGTPGSGDFGFMIISTDQLAGAADLKTWVATYIGPVSHIDHLGQFQRGGDRFERAPLRPDHPSRRRDGRQGRRDRCRDGKEAGYLELRGLNAAGLRGRSAVAFRFPAVPRLGRSTDRAGGPAETTSRGGSPYAGRLKKVWNLMARPMSPLIFSLPCMKAAVPSIWPSAILT